MDRVTSPKYIKNARHWLVTIFSHDPKVKQGTEKQMAHWFDTKDSADKFIQEISIEP